MEEDLLKIINHYGFDNQFNKLKEEMTELAFYRDEENLKEEIADVLVVLQQLVLYKDWADDVANIMFFKIKRQLDRIKEESKS